MKYLLKNAKVFIKGEFTETDVLVSDGVIVSLSKDIVSDERNY